MPYYRSRMEQAGLRPRDILGVEDFARIPVSRRADFQRVPFETRIARGVDAQSCIRRATSGSTGEPLQLLRSRREEYLLFAFRLRAQIFSGLRPFDRRVKLGSAPTLLPPHRLGFFRTSSLGLHLPPEEILRQLKEIRLRVIYGNPATLKLLLATAPVTELAALRPKMIFTGGGLLPSGWRSEIEERFACPVVDFYGCHEVNLIAWECRRCGLYHTSDDSVLVEILKDGRAAAPGEEGEVFLTALHSYAMPLIRIETRDLARRPAVPRDCEIGFGSIELICGRTADHLPLADGSWFSPFLATDMICKLPGIRCFQIVQEALDRITVLFVPLEDARETALAIENLCRPLIPAGVAVQARPVEDIPLSPDGKIQFVRALQRE